MMSFLPAGSGSANTTAAYLAALRLGKVGNRNKAGSQANLNARCAPDRITICLSVSLKPLIQGHSQGERGKPPPQIIIVEK